MSSSSNGDQVLPDRPIYRPLERFWPYADLPEQPSDEELAALTPELRAAIFGAPPLPFSISVEFPAYDGPDFERALSLARASDEYIERTVEGRARYRARFFPGLRPMELRDLWELIADVDGTQVLVDDQPVPYARELWLPLVWFLIR